MSGDISAVALSAIRASEKRLEVAADNIANSEARRKEVQQTTAPEGGVKVAVVEREGTSGDSIDRDVVDAQVASYTAEANIKVLKAADEMNKQIIDLQA